MKKKRTQGIAACLIFWFSGALVGLPTSAPAQGAAASSPEVDARQAQSVGATNSSPALAPPKFDALRRLEEQLNQALKKFSPKSDLEGMAGEVRPPQRPAANAPRSDERMKDAFDRKKNWGFMSLEEMMGLPKTDTASKELGIGDTKEKSKRSLIEQYYESLGKKESEQDSSLNSGDRSLATMGSAKEDDSMPPRLRETKNSLQKLFDSDGNGRIFESTPEGSSTSDIFGLGKNGMSASSREIAHRAYMDQYREVLGITTTGSDAGKMSDPMSYMNSKTPLSAASPLGRTSSRDNGFGQLGSINPVLTPKGPEDANTRVLNQWNPLYTPPTVDLRPQVPQNPSWAAPRRKF